MVQVRDWVPPPQLTEQLLHPLHPPLMGQSGLARQQLTARPVPVPEHVQVALPPQLPAL